MGLAEKRATKAFVDSKFPEFKSTLSRTIGFDCPIEVDWDKMAHEGYADQYNNFWGDGCFLPLIEAFKAICTDDLGRDELKKTLKKIVLKGEYAHSIAANFESGTLTLDFCFYNAVGGPGTPDFADREKTILKTLEKGL